MKQIWRVVWVLVLFVVGVLPAAAQGPIVAPPPDIIIEEPPQRGVALQLIEERVQVTVNGQVATTRVAQTFRNPSDWALEGEYLFPLPADAAISDMDMTVNGEKLEGQLMTAEQARSIYEEIVRQKMDPALLEWLGSGLFRTHIFPIPPGETRLIELEYTQLLAPENGLFHYRFPLRQAGATNLVPTVSVSLRLEGDAPLRAVYSPSHEVDVLREGERGATVGWEGSNVSLDEDFSLFWSVSPEEIDVNLLSFKEPGEDGFFLLLAAPPVEPLGESVVARDVVVVLDTSGSMEGAKMEQARAAVDFLLAHLNPDDRFNVIAFSTGTRAFSQRLQPASEVAAARRWVAELQPGGSTNISLALLEALDLGRDSDRSMLLIFMTDGLPTDGIVDREGILNAVLQDAPEDVRAFTFGVGYDVDTLLLDALAAEMRGSAGYVTPEERVDEEISAFYSKVSAPVLADVRLDWGDAFVEELYPAPLPDLFAGQQLVLAGRYREGGAVSLTLSGDVNGSEQSFQYDSLRLAGDGQSDDGWLPRLWATRKIGTLLQGIRRNGENSEAVEEIVDLAIRYGIVTPYTTFLVDEEEDFFSEEGRNSVMDGAAPPPPAASGATAVEEAETASDLASSERAAPMPTQPMGGEDGGAGGVAAPVIRTVGAKSFVQRGGRWVDTRFTEAMTPVEVPFGSDAYFALASRSPEVARYLSVGVPLVVVVEGSAYLIVATDAPDTRGTTPTPLAKVTEVAVATPTPAPVVVATTPQSEATPVTLTAPATEAGSSAPLMAVGVVGALLVGAAGWSLTRRRG